MKRVVQMSAILAGTCLAAHGYGQGQPPAPAPGAAEAQPGEPGAAPKAGEQPPAAQPPAAQPPAAQPPAAQPPAAQPPAAEPAPAAQPAATQTATAAAETASEKTAATASAEATPPEEDETDEGTSLDTLAARESRATLGLAPGAPQTSALPGGVSPAFGAAPTRAGDWRFDFHGFLTLPLRIGIGERENAGEGQKVTTLHAPPMIPGDFETFEYTSVVPDPWAQLNFSYGNPNVIANIIVAARTLSTAAGYFYPPDHLGINDAWLTFRLPASKSVLFNENVGAFSNRYGHMGEYDLGKYGTPLIARISGMGFTGTGVIEMGDVDLTFETGFQGQINKAPVGVEPAGWNGYADPNVGTSFAAHGHGAVGLFKKAQLGVHLIYTFVQDDRAGNVDQPDGNISVTGSDLRLTLGRYGHFFAGVAFTKATRSRPVSAVLRVLNAPGGPGLIEEYFGPESGGSGSLTTYGAQYDFSLGNFLRYPAKFDGTGPDVVASLFTIFTRVRSDDDQWDRVNKLKYGTEIAYSPLSWFAGALRYDRVIPDVDYDPRTTAIVTPRLIFRSDWNAQDQVVLQYSRYFNGSAATTVYGDPPVRDPSYDLDENVVSLSASMWW